MKLFKASAVKWEEGWPAPLILLKSRGEAARRLVQSAENLGIEIKQNDFLAESLDLVPEGTFVPEEYFAIMAVILAEVYAKEKQ